MGPRPKAPDTTRGIPSYYLAAAAGLAPIFSGTVTAVCSVNVCRFKVEIESVGAGADAGAGAGPAVCGCTAASEVDEARRELGLDDAGVGAGPVGATPVATVWRVVFEESVGGGGALAGGAMVSGVTSGSEFPLRGKTPAGH